MASRFSDKRIWLTNIFIFKLYTGYIWDSPTKKGDFVARVMNTTICGMTLA